jgi:adenylate cyclase
MEDDDLIAEGLYDPTADPMHRPALIRRARQLGMTDDQIRAAGNVLEEAAVFHVYGTGRDELTGSEVAERAGVDVEVFEKINNALGQFDWDDLSDRRVFSQSDVDILATFAAGTELLGEDGVLRVLAVAGSATARIGDAIISIFLTNAGAPAVNEDDGGLAVLEANISAAALLSQLGDFLTATLIRYARLSPRPMSETFLAGAASGVDTQDLTIGFADLAGSTTHAENRSLSELNDALDAFEMIARETIQLGKGRVVKFIGDEVMFRTEHPAQACRIALDLIAKVRSDDRLPPLRVGLATGEVLGRDGDYFGSVVNLAARITKLAPLQGVLAEPETALVVDAEDDLVADRLGAIEMQGISEPVELAAITAP